MNIRTIGFIGLGLIGGSLAKTIRRVYPDMRLIGYNRSKESLVAAMADGTLNLAQDTIGDSFAACDMIFLCAPVEVNVACLEKLKGIVREDCILTDVGSVKTPIHEAVEKLGLAAQFIGGHPMAGSERVGYQNAADRLLENAYFILTLSGKTPDWMLEDYQQLVQDIGSLPIVLDYREHDRATAAISHMPHMIAYTMVNVVRRADGPDHMMQQLAAGGFKDITRIASSSPDMWKQICRENKDALLDILGRFQGALSELEEAIRSGDEEALDHEFRTARDFRDNMPRKVRGLLAPSFILGVDLADEPGAIAVVLMILAFQRINLQNLEIAYNRDSQDGILRIYLPDEDSLLKARDVLEARNYTTYIAT